MLTGGELVINQDLTIDGGTATTAIDAGQSSRILNIAGAGTDVELSRLRLSGGWSDPENGGASCSVAEA